LCFFPSFPPLPASQVKESIDATNAFGLDQTEEEILLH
jgi:hypothetical protein